MDQTQLDELVALSNSFKELVAKLGAGTPADGFSKSDLNAAVAALEALVTPAEEPV